MVVVVFRARLKAGIGKDYEETDARMAALAATMPGFVSYMPCTSADGEDVAIIEFESHESVAAWKAHPEHREAQRPNHLTAEQADFMARCRLVQRGSQARPLRSDG